MRLSRRETFLPRCLNARLTGGRKRERADRYFLSSAFCTRLVRCSAFEWRRSNDTSTIELSASCLKPHIYLYVQQGSCKPVSFSYAWAIRRVEHNWRRYEINVAKLLEEKWQYKIYAKSICHLNEDNFFLSLMLLIIVIIHHKIIFIILKISLRSVINSIVLLSYFSDSTSNRNIWYCPQIEESIIETHTRFSDAALS